MTQSPVEREMMEFDLVIIGAGPAGLSAAIRAKQCAAKAGQDISVVVVEKGSEVGAHILSGAVVDPVAMNELFPDWQAMGCPLETAVTEEKFLYLGPAGSWPLPVFAMPKMVKNHGCYIASMGNVCRWLAAQAEGMGVEIYPMMAASAYLTDESGAISGVVVGEMGKARDGTHKDSYEPGMALHGKYTLIAEGVRGSLTQKLIAAFGLDSQCEPQKYGIGLKELWKVPDALFKPGFVQHTFGWPLDNSTGGGSFCYHFGDHFVSVGFVVHLNYKNPFLSPYEEFQRFKHHPEIARYLEGGERIAYGARAISEGGFQSVPKLTFPGGALIGCAAGFVNVPRIKGNHNAMTTGMLAAEAAVDAIVDGRSGDELVAYTQLYEKSRVYKELKTVRNVKPLWSKYGTVVGGIALGAVDLYTNSILNGMSIFGTLGHKKTDADATQPAKLHTPIIYPPPDGVLSFDRLTNVAFSATNHEENQPVHLTLRDADIPVAHHLALYAGPSARYCPAGVYEFISNADGTDHTFQINAQNCVHCKTCDIKDPSQNIIWTTPEGGGGPNYPNM